MRELKPTGEEKPDRSVFADIDALAEQCRFRDCKHVREPGCAVRVAIEAGTLDPDRVVNWRKLMDEVEAAARTLEARRGRR